MKPIATLAILCAIMLAVDGPPAAAQHHHAAPPAGPPRSESVYELSASLVDQDGGTVELDVFRGHPVLISMFYGSCPDACPLLIADLKRIEGGLSPQIRADLRVLLVSFDPEHDTPDVLQKLARAHDLDRARWRLARASDDTVRDIAAMLGIRYRRLPEGGFNHSSVITLLDASGVVLTRIDGVGQPVDAVQERLQARR